MLHKKRRFDKFVRLFMSNLFKQNVTCYRKNLFSPFRQNPINFCSIGIPQNKKKGENLPANKL